MFLRKERWKGGCGTGNKTAEAQEAPETITDTFRGTLPDGSRHGQSGFRIYPGKLFHHFFGLNDQLGSSVEIPQDKKTFAKA